MPACPEHTYFSHISTIIACVEQWCDLPQNPEPIHGTGRNNGISASRTCIKPIAFHPSIHMVLHEAPVSSIRLRLNYLAGKTPSNVRGLDVLYIEIRSCPYSWYALSSTWWFPRILGKYILGRTIQSPRSCKSLLWLGCGHGSLVNPALPCNVQ
jgi:hypothetical protein